MDIISIGDATTDMFLNLHEANARCSIKTETCELCFTYADKIPVESIERIDGAGNASNNAVGSARLGMETAIMSILGGDDTGDRILARWKKEGVATTFVTRDKNRNTNFSTVLNFRGERTILVYHEKRNYVFSKKLPKTSWVYYTSMAKGSEVLHHALLAHCKKTHAKLVFQPGTFQLKLGIEELAPLIAASELTIVNKEEAEQLVGDSTRDVRVLLSRLRHYGCRTAVITDGPDGSYTYDGSRYVYLGIFDTPVVERTGCGDAYATGLIAALHHEKPLAEAMRWGTANSASVLGSVGPQKGLLTRRGIAALLKRFPAQPSEL